MKAFRSLMLALLLCVAPSLFGQTFTIAGDVPDYKATAGQITFTVNMSGLGTPGALGFRIVPPASWTFGSVSGTNPPLSLSATGGKHDGTNGFEFYYITAPVGTGSFKVTLNYPAGQTGSVTIASQLLHMTATGPLSVIAPASALPNLNLQQAPIITLQPVAANLIVGNSLNLSMAATGPGTLTYQWKKDSKAIAGATSATYSVASVDLIDGGTYIVDVTNAYGKTSSSAAVVKVTATPILVTTPPVDATVVVGNSLNLSVSANGLGTLSYQWKKDGKAIAGATSQTYAVASVLPADAGSYVVDITNVYGKTSSTAAVVTVTPPPITIAAQPVAATLDVGASLNLSVTASGLGTFTYQWKKDGKVITGATANTFTKAAAAETDSGSYTVEISNGYGGKSTSTAATVLVTQKPGIVTHPAATTVAAAGTVTLTVKAVGTAPLNYQWYFNNTAITGAKSSTYTIAKASSATSGTYKVTVTNAVDPIGVTSNPAIVTTIATAVTAVHAANVNSSRGYAKSGVVTVTNTITFTSKTTGLAWQVSIPADFTYAGDTATGVASAPAAAGAGVLEWVWDALPTSPITFSYTLNVSATATGDQDISAVAYARQSGDTLPTLATPDPVRIVPAGTAHSADSDGDWTIDLTELQRIVSLYGTQNASVRTGCYAVDGATVDGFSPAPTRTAMAFVLSKYHSADSNKDGMISLSELMRVVELYRTMKDTVRTGEYHVETGTEDGYSTGP